MIEFNDSGDSILYAHDPVQAAIIDEKVKNKDERRAIRIKNEILRREMVRKEEEKRLEELPPPPILPKRWEIRFDNPKGGKGTETKKKGTVIKVQSSEPAMIIPNASCTNDPYVIEDFPPDADDIPGTFDPYIDPNAVPEDV